MNRASSKMIGNGTPINQSKAPFPNDIAASIIRRGNISGFRWFHSRRQDFKAKTSKPRLQSQDFKAKTSEQRLQS
jgi:hypothetical protein